jgi:lysozyme family protein
MSKEPTRLKKLKVKRLTFEVAMHSVFNSEGGYSNHPKDSGGVTYKGISSAFYKELVKDHPKRYRNVSVTKLTQAERLAIYRKWFWEASGADRIPNPALALQVFDHAVNASVFRANKLLKNGNTTPKMYRNARHTAYENDPNCATFCDGWHPRVERVYKKGLELS